MAMSIWLFFTFYSCFEMSDVNWWKFERSCAVLWTCIENCVRVSL